MKAKLETNYKASLDRYEAFIRKMDADTLKMSTAQIRWRLAQGAAALVRRKYRSYSGGGPSGIHLASVTLGKRVGEFNKARRGREATPITEMLANAVEASGDAKSGFLVGIGAKASKKGGQIPRHPDKHRKGYPQGIPLSTIAHWIEHPKDVIVDVTMKMVGYLRTISKGKPGFGTRKSPKRPYLPSRKTGKTIIFKQPERPVWSAVHKDLVRLKPKYDREIRSLLEGLANKYGTRSGRK